MSQSSSDDDDGWDNIDPVKTLPPVEKQSNQSNYNRNQKGNLSPNPEIPIIQSKSKQIKKVEIQRKNFYYDQMFPKRNKFSIPEHKPIISFIKSVTGFIDRKTQNHIENWKTHNSERIQDLYRDLEYDHAFIQWIFPNFFQSMFNPSSQRLTLEERNEIIKDETFTAFYLDNFRMFSRFLGIKVDLANQFNHHFYMVQTLCISKKHARYYQHFEILKEEDNKSNTGK